MKSKWGSRILFLSIGLLLGVIITSSLIFKSTKTASDLISLSTRAWEANQAINAYQYEKTEVGRYALAHYQDLLKFYYDNKTQDGFPEATAQDLAFTYIRLGNIAKTTKKYVEAEQFYEKGYSIYKQYRIASGQDVPSREKLIESVNKMDNQRKPIAISFSDSVAGLRHAESK